MEQNYFDATGQRVQRRGFLQLIGAGGIVVAANSAGRRALAAAAQEPIDFAELDAKSFYVKPSPEFASKQWTIGFSNASETNTWRTALREAIQAEATLYPNIKLLITDAHDSPSKQVADLEDLLAKGCRGLIIGAATTDIADPILNQTEREKIPVIIVDRMVTSQKYTTFVSSDNHYMAAKVLTYLCSDLLKGTGKIAIVEGIPGSGPAIERNAAYDEVLKRFPGIVPAARQAGDWSRASGLRVIENIITAHRDLNGIHFDGGEMALGGIQALREAGFSDKDMVAGKPFLTGLDNYNGWLGAIEKGIGKITILHPPRVHGWVSVQTLVQALMGQELPKLTSLRRYQATVTPENAHIFYKPDKPDDYWAL
jgi:ribose transport system substrate-binding protein